ncbi:Rho termination factor N-terminal domain-containing protein [bacterium]|nr:Rho termination factor N-terminal domain-containing protein [bacterium]
MADYTYDELKHKTVAELKEIAAGIEHEAVQGYTQMNKVHVIEAICKALDLDMHVHHEVKGVDKAGIKKKIKALKVERDKAIEGKDYKELKNVRRQIKKLKNTLRRAMV